MKKIGIATLYTGSTNYGGCLQAYALCKVLKDIGYDPYQITYKPYNHSSMKQKIIRAIKGKLLLTMLKVRFHSIIVSVQNRIHQTNDEINTFKQSFCEFRDSIPHTSMIYNDVTINQCSDFDVYITGSDQVWNLWSSLSLSPFYWLEFVGDNKKKISYAASISKKDFPRELYPKVKELLSSYSAISVREKSDKELLDRILDSEKVQWVLDPTLLLYRDDWERVCEKNPFIERRYVFAYLLGDNMKHRKFVTEWAKKHNKIVINIPYLLGHYRKCDKNFGDIKKSDVTPNLWLSLIRDADCVFTDSFHATVFSSIFHTPFYVFKRSKDSSKHSMNSRIYSLMQLFDTENRIVNDDSDISSLININEIDFSKIDRIIAAEKRKSIAFLKNAIEG